MKDLLPSFDEIVPSNYVDIAKMNYTLDWIMLALLMNVNYVPVHIVNKKAIYDSCEPNCIINARSRTDFCSVHNMNIERGAKLSSKIFPNNISTVVSMSKGTANAKISTHKITMTGLKNEEVSTECVNVILDEIDDVQKRLDLAEDRVEQAEELLDKLVLLSQSDMRKYNIKDNKQADVYYRVEMPSIREVRAEELVCETDPLYPLAEMYCRLTEKDWPHDHLIEMVERVKGRYRIYEGELSIKSMCNGSVILHYNLAHRIDLEVLADIVNDMQDVSISASYNQDFSNNLNIYIPYPKEIVDQMEGKRSKARHNFCITRKGHINQNGIKQLSREAYDRVYTIITENSDKLILK